MSEDTEILEGLRSRYDAAAMHLDLETPDGRRWRQRMEESERYFRRYSNNWESNRKLLVDFKEMVRDFGTYVGIAYPIISNFISDMYSRNPDPLIQDKGGDRALSRILTDVARSVHAESDSEREFHDAFQDQAWAGFGVIAVSFDQKPDNAGEPIMEPVPDGDEGGEPSQTADQPGAPMAQRMRPSGQEVEPTEQKILIRRISPWRCRFDPKGRRWDMSDHRFWAFDSFEYLGPLLRDPRLSDADRARLMAFYSRGGPAFSVYDPEYSDASSYSAQETDPEYIPVCMRTIWSRPDHMIYRMPYGAAFTFTPQPWDEEWERADMFPIRYMPRNRVPENQSGSEGFIGLADLELIRPHIVNINKAQGLLVSGLSQVIDAYVTAKGALSKIEVGKLEDGGRIWKIIEVDLESLAKYPTQQQEKFSWDDILHLLPTGDKKDLQHMAFIDHEFGLIAQIMGQGPADRGGITDSETATQSLGQQQGLERRMSANRNEAGKHYNAVTKMVFLVLQARHTLPLRYQAATKRFDEKVWLTLTDPKGTLKNIDLHFEYATGSSEPRTAAQEFALRQQAAAILMPVFQAQQDWRMVLKVAQDLIEPLHILNADEYFDDEINGLVMQLITIMRALALGSFAGQPVTADNEQIAAQIPELITQLAQKILTPQQLMEVEAQVQGVEAAQGGTQTGSMPSAPSPGEASADAGARGSAAAGMMGGVAAHQ